MGALIAGDRAGPVPRTRGNGQAVGRASASEHRSESGHDGWPTANRKVGQVRSTGGEGDPTCRTNRNRAQRLGTTWGPHVMRAPARVPLQRPPRTDAGRSRRAETSTRTSWGSRGPSGHDDGSAHGPCETETRLRTRPASPQQVTAGPAQPGRDDNEGGDSHPASPQDPRATCLGGFPQPTMPPQREPRTCAAGRVRSAASGAPRHARYLAARRRPPWPAEGTGGELAWTSDGHPSYHPCGMAPTDKRRHRHNKPTAGERGMASCRPACREFGARRCRQRRCGLPRAAKVVP
jgi:hypothetical protein